MALAYLVGGGRAHTGWIPAEVLATAVRPGPAIGLTAGALVAGAACVRQVWLEWLAWRPGRIEIGMSGDCPSVREADLQRLRMQFRQRLATLRLQAPAPVPGTAPEGDFLEVLSRGATEAPNLLATIFSLIRAAKPTHAWQVSSVLVERARGAALRRHRSGRARCPRRRTRRSRCGPPRGTTRCGGPPTAPPPRS